MNEPPHACVIGSAVSVLAYNAGAPLAGRAAVARAA
jgi:hypothetical protein